MNNLLKLISILGKNIKNEITIRQLAKLSEIPYTTTYRIIANNKQLFMINPKANIKLVSLNLHDNITKHYLILSERESNEDFINKNKIFSILKNNFYHRDYCLILFGSRAEGKEREKSDIDLCIINKDGGKDINFDEFQTLSDKKVNPIFLSKKEFLEMLKEKEHNLSNEIIKKHIIFYNEEYFWNLIWSVKDDI